MISSLSTSIKRLALALLVAAAVVLLPAPGSAQIDANQIRWPSACGSLQYYSPFDGLCHSPTATGLGDPGANGIVKRTALNTTTIAAGADIVSLWASGSCSGYLKNDLTCGTPSGGLGDPTANGFVYRTALNTTAVGTLSQLIAAYWADSSCTSNLYMKKDGTCGTPAGTGLSDPGANGCVYRTASTTTAVGTLAQLIAAYWADSSCSSNSYLEKDGTCGSGGSAAGPTVVGHTFTAEASASSTTTVSSSITVTAGQKALISFRNNGSPPSSVTITDSLGNSCSATIRGSGGGDNISLGYCTITTGGSDTFTVTGGSAVQYRSLNIFLLTGVGTYASVAGSSTGTGGTGYITSFATSARSLIMFCNGNGGFPSPIPWVGPGITPFWIQNNGSDNVTGGSANQVCGFFLLPSATTSLGSVLSFYWTTNDGMSAQAFNY
jgi:hypothetical protein